MSAGFGVATPTSTGGASFSSAAMRDSFWQLRRTKPLAHQQIARKIAHQRQFRRHHQVRALLSRAARAARTISAELPSMSPAVGLI